MTAKQHSQVWNTTMADAAVAQVGATYRSGQVAPGLGAHRVEDVGEVAKRAVAPVVELGDRRARPALCGQLGVRHAEADEPCEQRLVHAGILLKGLVLDNRRQLVVVSDENDLHTRPLLRR